MEKPSFAVRLADLERGPQEVTFVLSEDWLRKALSDAHAEPLGPGEATVELTKTGGLVLVRGSARVKLTVPCVVTLDPVPLDLEPEISLELAREAEAPDRPRGAPKADKKQAKPPKARSARRATDEPEFSSDEGARDTFRGEEVVLDDFFREFILLEIPPYPRRSDLPSPEESISSRPLAGPSAEAKPIDPRLAPLLGIASRLKGSANKE